MISAVIKKKMYLYLHSCFDLLSSIYKLVNLMFSVTDSQSLTFDSSATVWLKKSGDLWDIFGVHDTALLVNLCFTFSVVKGNGTVQEPCYWILFLVIELGIQFPCIRFVKSIDTNIWYDLVTMTQSEILLWTKAQYIMFTFR